jgi:hypothetical protein
MRAHVALRMSYRAFRPQRIPDRIRICDPLWIEIVEVCRPVKYRLARTHVYPPLALPLGKETREPAIYSGCREASLIPQGNHGVDPRRSPGGNIASRKSNDHEDHRDPNERKRVMGCDAEELAAHQTRKAKCKKDAR